MRRLNNRGFTLIELIVVIAILGLLASVGVPEMNRAIERARSTSCMGNLRQIGIAVTSYVADNDGAFPYVEPNEQDPVYPEDVDEDGNQDKQAKPLLEELGVYGIDKHVLKCPSDKKYFTERGTSYQWRPIIDGEKKVNSVIYGRRGAISVNPRRITICTDYESLHFNRPNRLRGDGSVGYKLK
jgi:prepilin-type N-terminal cleavage/methylation domain-containing protein